MINTPKSLRLQIGIFGRTNVGKSTLLNLIAQQDVAIVSPVPGTTTDIVEKQMELLPIGPVTFLDTAGLDDTSILAENRIERTKRIFSRADIVLIVLEPNKWTDFENQLLEHLKELKIPFLYVISKIDIETPSDAFINNLKSESAPITQFSYTDISSRDNYINDIKNAIISILPEGYLTEQPLMGDLISPGGLAVFIIPIDSQAPKGRLILPQVQAIRDILDNDSISIVLKETEYPGFINQIKKFKKPDIVVCDSQVVHKMIAETPEDVPCTTFSILFARYKGDIEVEARGAAAISKIKPGDKVLIAEACSHHPLKDDIGRIKIPKWMSDYLGGEVVFEVANGRDFPPNLKEYKLIIHCGGCMLTRHEKLVRIKKAVEAEIPITNYGMTIAFTQGFLERVLTPFPDALKSFREVIAK